MDEIPVFDGHNDTLLNLHLPDRGEGRSFFERSELGHIDLLRAREGGFGGGFFACYTPNPEDDGWTEESALTFTEDGYEVWTLRGSTQATPGTSPTGSLKACSSSSRGAGSGS